MSLRKADLPSLILISLISAVASGNGCFLLLVGIPTLFFSNIDVK